MARFISPRWVATMLSTTVRLLVRSTTVLRMPRVAFSSMPAWWNSAG